jgi:hypothetical protein
MRTWRYNQISACADDCVDEQKSWLELNQGCIEQQPLFERKQRRKFKFQKTLQRITLEQYLIKLTIRPASSLATRCTPVPRAKKTRSATVISKAEENAKYMQKLMEISMQYQ